MENLRRRARAPLPARLNRGRDSQGLFQRKRATVDTFGQRLSRIKCRDQELAAAGFSNAIAGGLVESVNAARTQMSSQCEVFEPVLKTRVRSVPGKTVSLSAPQNFF